MSELNNIPKHWQVKKLGEVADYINGRAFKPTEWEGAGIPIIRIQNLNKSDAAYNYSTKEFETKYELKKGDLLYAWSASLGVYIWQGEKAWLNQHIFKVVPKSICNKKFLFYTLDKITAELYSKAHGSGMVHVTKGKFENTHIFLPPLPEQLAIVSKIEELLSDLENGKQQLLTAQQQLKVYRQSLLKAAFDGRLTNEGVNEGVLPEGWKWVKLKEVSNEISDGDHQAPPKSNEGIPFITISNVNKNTNKIDFTETFKVDVIYYSNLKYNRKPQKGDVLYTVTGSFGIPILIDFDKEFCFQRHIGLIRPKEIINQKWLFYLLQSPNIYSQAKNAATGTAQKTVSLSSLRNFEIPYCTLSEQHQIVEILESKLTICDKIAETISQSLLQADTLKQSILKKAFEGKLV